MNSPLSLTVTSNNGRLKELKTDCVVFQPHRPEKTPPQQLKNIKGINCICLWDTGASSSCISKRLAKDLGLVQTGVANTFTAAGPSQTKTYVVNIGLPNHVQIPMVMVSEAELNGFDVLIGMDVITLGDFSITNVNGKTVFSFRIPSTETIDYVQQGKQKVKAAHTPYVAPKTPERNDPCPCGSGKKFKNCHGKGL
ncbi:MAG: SEC-C metal-binding domain-containing protein [Prevotellaceae bacterium]|nr:SEC-C metal-binding domain-containing protein [Prevotellaceae bacterium]